MLTAAESDSRISGSSVKGVTMVMLQAAIAVLLAGAVTLKHSWHRFRDLFRGSNRDQSDLDLDD